MMTKDEALKMAIDFIELHLTTNDRTFIERQATLEACKEALEPNPMTTTDVITCKMTGKCCMTGEALEQPAQEPVALLEALSDLEHQQWIKWAKSIIDSEPISDARKQRWLTMMVDYKDLPDNIQEYDREWARKVMALTHPHQVDLDAEYSKGFDAGYEARFESESKSWQGDKDEE